MGYRCDLGATRACRFHNGYLEIKGAPDIKRKTSVQIDTEWQLNIFDSFTVWFVVIDGDDLYIGLNTGEINVMSSKGLIKAIHGWEIPVQMCTTIGYYSGPDGVKQIIISHEEPRVANVVGVRATYILNEDVKTFGTDLNYGNNADRLSSCLSHLLFSGVETVISDERGEHIDITKSGYWLPREDVTQIPIIEFR